MKSLQIGGLPIIIATLLLSACGGGTHAASVPVSGGGVGQAPSSARTTVAAKRAKLMAAVARDNTMSMDQEISDAASHGRRVFRYQQVMIFDPQRNATYTVLPSDLTKTSSGYVLFGGTHAQITLSRSATVRSSPLYTYLFRKATDADPSRTLHAERVR